MIPRMPKTLKLSMKRNDRSFDILTRINAGITGLISAFFVIPILLLIPAFAQDGENDTWPEITRRHLFQSIPLYDPATSVIEIAAVGDLMMSSWIVEQVAEKGVDYPFDSTRIVLQKADLAIANLEAPLTQKGERFFNKTYTFKVPPDFISGMSNAGFDVFTLANNHIVDFGCEGLTNTIYTLRNAGIQYSGAGDNINRACEPAFVSVNDVKVAFLGFSMTYPQEFWATSTRCGTCYPTEELLYTLVTDCESRADITVVSFHWGAEKHTYPRDYQMEYGRAAIDYGADLVLGHHPHVLQGFELYQGKLIAYSLGNYVFGSYSYAAKTSAMVVIKLDHQGLIMARIIPLNVFNAEVQFQPRELRGEDRDRVIQHLNDISMPLNGGERIIDEKGFISRYPIVEQF